MAKPDPTQSASRVDVNYLGSKMVCWGIRNGRVERAWVVERKRRRRR
jgi:hypothetical protein